MNENSQPADLKPSIWAKTSKALGRELRSLFRAGVPLRARFYLAIAAVLPDFTMPSLRSLLHRKAGFNLGKEVALLGALRFVGEGDLTKRLVVGNGSIIAPEVTFGLDGAITLGTNVSIGPRAVLYTGTHSLGFGSRRMNALMTARAIVVEDGVWIGMQSLIMPGVTLGRGSVIAAGSVVHQDVPPNTMVMGNPATVHQDLPFGNR